jgi:argininosuccinate lyase
MEKMWAGRFKEKLDAKADEFNSSIRVDSVMVKCDIKGSIAHANMLAAQKIISPEDGQAIVKGLTGIYGDIESGALQIDFSAEDVHMFVEAELTKRLGDAGKRLHTARSRNDQVALDTRLYLKQKTAEIRALLLELIKVLVDTAKKYGDAVMPGYTHLQRAQPIVFGHHIAAYAYMFERDFDRLGDCAKRMDFSPLGSAALAGTSYPIDRRATAKELGFEGIVKNSMDGVSDRDFVIELASALSIIMMHLSRFCEEIILWCSWEFKFIELDDAFSTGSSIMPQKKNPDMAELIRGKTGRVYGNLMGILTVMKALPLAYNKDMQEDKEGVFDSVNTVSACLPIFAAMVATMRVNRDNMLSAAKKGFINATDCADYLTKKGMPFRDSYKLTGEMVAYCIQNGITLDEITPKRFKEFSPLFENDIFGVLDMANCASSRTSEGGASYSSVLKQLAEIEEFLEANKND